MPKLSGQKSIDRILIRIINFREKNHYFFRNNTPFQVFNKESRICIFTVFLQRFIQLKQDINHFEDYQMSICGNE